MSTSASIAIAGAGLIGKRHIQAIKDTKGASLGAIIDPGAGAEELAKSLNVPWHENLERYLAGKKPDGLIIATPNQMHRENTLAAIEAKVPTLVEKPLADMLDAAREMVCAAHKANVPLLVGHHRRHNALVERAHRMVSDGKLGDIVVVNAMCWLFKPDEYFNTQWRKQSGGGPVFINLIHDVDLLRYLCGEIVWVQALASNAVRKNDVEETSVAIVRFENGALGTISVSDCVVSPWSWELTAKENPAYHPTGQACYLIGGTHGSLELPDNRTWQNKIKRSWWEPVEADLSPLETGAQEVKDPLIRQIEHFCAVIRGDETPLVSGLEGLKTLGVIDALTRSAARGGEGIAIQAPII